MLKTNPERTKKIIEILLDWYKKRDGIFTGSDLPESAPPNGMMVGSYEHIMFLTMTVSIDYQRSAQDLWNVARISWQDENTRWIFSPAEISKRSHDELVGSLAKHKLSKKKNKDADIWRKVSLSFLELFEGDPRKMFEKFDYDALQIFNAMRAQYGRHFPYLAGSTGTGKILSLWIRIMNKEGKINFKNLNKVPIPIDIHTARSTITTGCLVGTFEGSFSKLTDEAKEAWIEACDGTDHYPLELDEPLWNLSRYGCTNYTSGTPCPVANQCKLAEFCVSNHTSSKISLQQNGITTIDTKHPEQK